LDLAELAKDSVTGEDGQADGAPRPLDYVVCNGNCAYHKSDDRVDGEAKEEAQRER
jgi:hypothetical protein